MMAGFHLSRGEYDDAVTVRRKKKFGNRNPRTLRFCAARMISARQTRCKGTEWLAAMKENPFLKADAGRSQTVGSWSAGLWSNVIDFFIFTTIHISWRPERNRSPHFLLLRNHFCLLCSVMADPLLQWICYATLWDIDFSTMSRTDMGVPLSSWDTSTAFRRHWSYTFHTSIFLLSPSLKEGDMGRHNCHLLLQLHHTRACMYGIIKAATSIVRNDDDCLVHCVVRSGKLWSKLHPLAVLSSSVFWFVNGNGLRQRPGWIGMTWKELVYGCHILIFKAGVEMGQISVIWRFFARRFWFGIIKKWYISGW